MTYNILITGANGLLGNEVTNILCQDHTVWSVVRSEPVEKISGVNYLKMDLGQEVDIAKLPDNIDVIIHLAQSDKFRDFPDKAMDVFQVNIHSTAKLLDYAYRNNVKHFIYASSGGVYGAEGGKFDENAPIDARYDLGYYLGSKLCSEILCQNYTKHFDVSILRFFFLYGQRQKRSMLLPRLVDSVKEGKAIYLQGSEGISINPIHVKDAAGFMTKILDKTGSQTINVAGNQTYSLKAICTMIGTLLNKEPVFEYISQEPRNLLADTSLMNNNYFVPAITLEEGIKELI